MVTRTTEPDTFIAGDTVKWVVDLDNYPPSDGWELQYVFVKDGTKKTVSSTDNGDGRHLLEISATESADYDAGQYYWQSYAKKDTERYSIRTGTIEVAPDFASQTDGFDNRSHVKKTLDALEAMIEGKASRDQMSVSVNGRSVGNMDPLDLIKWRDRYRAEYHGEIKADKVKNGLGVSNKVYVRFR